MGTACTRCGATNGERGAHDMFGDWHDTEDVEHMPFLVRLQAFGDAFPDATTIALDDTGRCQQCAPRTLEVQP